jgi:hypothetical protein
MKIGRTLLRLVKTLWRVAIRPFLIFMKPSYEYILHAGAVLTVFESARYPQDGISTIGAMMGYSAVVLYAGAMMLTGTVNKRAHVRSQTVRPEVLLSVLGFSFVAPVAVVSQSTLVGYGAIILLLTTLGFQFFTCRIITRIGFSIVESLSRCVIACFMFNLLYWAAINVGVPEFVTEPFRSAVTVFGTTVYFLGLMIGSVLYKQLLVVYFVNLALYLVMGEMYGHIGMSNVAKTFGFLELMALYSEVCLTKAPQLFILYAFSLCVLGYYGSYWLSAHPQYIAAMYSGLY